LAVINPIADMKNEDRIIELLIETLQKVDRHQEILEEHVHLWKEQNQRWDEQQDTNRVMLETLHAQMQELQKVSAAQTRNDLIDQEQSRRIEQMHQSWLQGQQVIQDMVSLLMAQNKALKDNGLM
jgi:uncharacterized protein YbaP (TraB family)